MGENLESNYAVRGARGSEYYGTYSVFRSFLGGGTDVSAPCLLQLKLICRAQDKSTVQQDPFLV